jgi:TRAP-type C4-dicarboxylate transport system permease large subunit
LVVLVVLGILFVAGLFVEATVLVLLLTPIFVPVVTAVGVDPVHFGILMMTIVTLGGMTPPVGVAMFAVCSLLDVRIGDYVREVVPFIATVVLLVLVLLYFPGLVLFLPDLVF